jgi:hypothetical protein
MRNRILKYFSVIALAFALSIASTPTVDAQCPMCRMSAESNLKNGGSSGKGLNAGILYMLATPYLIVGTIGFIWWRNRKREKEGELEELS